MNKKYWIKSYQDSPILDNSVSRYNQYARKTQLCFPSNVSRRRDNSLAFRRESSFPTAPRRCNIFTRRNGGRAKKGNTHLPVDLLNGRSTTSYTFRDALESRGNRRVFRKSTEKPRDSLAFLSRKLPSTFIPSAAFIDGKSVADSRSKISVEKPEEKCHFSHKDCRRYMPHAKFVERRKLDRQILWGCLVRC